MHHQYVPPIYGEESFNCPNCSAHAQQNWFEIKNYVNSRRDEYTLGSSLRIYEIEMGGAVSEIAKNGYLTTNLAAISKCHVCEKISVWLDGKMVYPVEAIAPLPSPDMPEDVTEIYNEARTISPLSPTASAALLRLALEKLLPQVGAKKAKIDTMIGDLVSKGLPKEVEKALDSLRVIGNEAVHPGTIDLQDNTDISIALFKLLNVVVDRMITQKREIDEIYSLIPENKIKGIEERNSRALKPQKN